MLPTSSAEHITSIAHFYRAEMSRMIAWRDRLDRTTNWAIAATGGMLSVTLASAESHHAVILCCMVLVDLLLAIEARRYRFYDESRSRVRLLEKNYFGRIFESAHEVSADWRLRLSQELERPHYTISGLDAVTNRLRRNYFWIYLVLLFSWWLKVSTVVLDARTGKAEFVGSLSQLAGNATVAYIPGWLVMSVVLLLTVVLFVLAGRRGKESGEADRREAQI